MSKTEGELIACTQEFADKVITQRAAIWDRDNKFDLDTIREAAGIGLTGIQVPAKFGGLGHKFSSKARIAEILAAADFGFAMSVINTQNVAQKLCRDASPDLVDRYVPAILTGERLGSTALTEPHAGSDFAAIKTTARRDGDRWLLNGSKAWIINSVASDVLVVYAQTEPGSGGAGIAAFLVDGQRDGFKRSAPFALTCPHSIGTGGFELDGYSATDREMLQPPGKAFKAALSSINEARTYVAIMCCGMVGKAIEIAADYGRKRTTFGKRLGEHQGWRWSLGDADVDLTAAQQLVAHAVELIDNGEDSQFAAAKAKIFATRLAEQHLPKLAQLMGAEGLQDQYPFGRHLVAARVAGFVDGSTEMLLERLTLKHTKPA